MRDYKHRVINRRRVREVPPWFWLVALGSGGALIVLIIYLAGLPQDGVVVTGDAANITDIAAPANMTTPTADNKPKSATSNPSSKKLSTTPPPPSTQARFEFFDALPKMKVDTPPEPQPVPPTNITPPRSATARAAATKEVQKNATEPTPRIAPTEPTRLPPMGDRYMLLAGYFRHAREAEQLQTRIGALGYSASVQSVKSAGTDPRYRVRLGPYSHQQAEDARNKLRAMGIHAVPLKSKN